MNLSFPKFLVLLSLLVICLPVQAEDKTPDFETEIAPLLIKRCVECHQGKNPSGNLLLTTSKGLHAGGDSGVVIDSESPKESYFLDRIHEGDMPPEKKGLSQKLPDEEIALLKRWIASGASWPEGRELDYFERTNEIRAGRDWWSLQPIVKPDPPQLQNSSQPSHPIDAFILSKLEQENMSLAPEADKRTLLKRLYYDLIGLPPTHQELEEFLNDPSSDAWEKKIDELLASKQYGVRWGRYWLDLVRYADTSGYERDQEKEYAWKYRDWVVEAFNQDMPYQQFVTEQIAGDEIPDSSEKSVIATGFHRLGTWNDEPNDPRDYIYERLEDMVHTTSSAFLAMTVKCARCHEHKFDPIKQEDYYRMGTAFWSGPIFPRDRKLLGGPSPDEIGFENVLGWTDLKGTPKPLHLLKNGERDHPLEEVVPASLSMIPKLEKDFEKSPEGSKTKHRRLQLAQWITDPDHPLTARVYVNRLWLHHFGDGIVRTPNNFGFLCDPPTHPELLNWLASEFKEGGWTTKRMHKLILTSRTWKQSSLHSKYEEYQLKDAGNRNWWHFKRKRLDAEALRDSMLTASNELDLKLGGPGFRPTISREALEGLSMKSNAWQASPRKDQMRRSLYTYFKRGLLPPMMTTFDLSDSTQTCGRRESTTVPTQALTLMNNKFVHQRSDHLAETVLEESTDSKQQIQILWKQVLGRTPDHSEMKLALNYLKKQEQQFEDLEKIETETEETDLVEKSESINESLALLLQADQGVVVDSSGRVTLWKDQSGNNHDAYQNDDRHQPTLDLNEFNGNFSLNFDGDQRYLEIKGSLLKKQDCTMITVVKDLGTEGHRAILSNWNGQAGNSVTSLFLGLTAEKTVRFSDNFSNAGQVSNRRNPFILTALNNSYESSVFLNSGEIAHRETSLSERNLKTGWVIGQQGNIQGEFWKGHIAEIRVYDRSLSEDERLYVEKELSQRYSIPVQLEQAEPKRSPRFNAFASLAHVLLNSNEFLYVD